MTTTLDEGAEARKRTCTRVDDCEATIATPVHQKTPAETSSTSQPGADTPPSAPTTAKANGQRPSRRRPLWRFLFDCGERAVGGPLEVIVRSDEFYDALAIVTRARNKAMAELERMSRESLHLFNLPAASDIHQLQDRIASLDRQVKTLSHRLNGADETPEPPGKA